MISPPGATPPRLTALVTCRNSAATMVRLLEHLRWHGAETIVIDNGSTDETGDIARAHVGQGVSEVISDPYRGYFDLTHQLTLKRTLTRDLDEGWILHADADEFLDSPDGSPLTDYLGYWGDSEITAFDCDEFMFLPQNENERHSPESFIETMQAYVHFAERNPKQRLFRATASVERWLETGGHTIAGPDDTVAPVRLRLRHYFGLSLDQIRAEYLPRVFSPGDLSKLWHGSRIGAAVDVVPPDPARFSQLADGWKSDISETRVPVFRSRRARALAKAPVAGTDLHIVAFSKAAGDLVSKLVTEAVPDLRLCQSDRPPADAHPVLNVLEHPARSGSEPLPHAENWLRHVAVSRQHGLSGVAQYAEVRVEDLEQTTEPLADLVHRLLIGSVDEPVLTPPIPEHSSEPYDGRLRDITLPMARDLGYR